MPLLPAIEIIDTLAKKPEFEEIKDLKCFKKEENDLFFYLFSIYIKTEEELNAKYELIRDFIAIYFQSEMLEKEVERWNLYVFFFIGEKVETQTKYKIEQDKFSTRKIVIDEINEQEIINEPSDNKITSIINNELFEFKIEEVESIENDKKISVILQEKHTEVYSFNNSYPEKLDKETFELMINQLGNE